MVGTGSDTSSMNERDVEFGAPGAAHQDIAPNRHSLNYSSSYDEPVVRVVVGVLSDPEKQVTSTHLGLGTPKAVSTTRTTNELESVIGTPFDVKWTDADPDNPLNWTLAKRGYILAVVSMQTLLVVFYSTSYVSGAPGMRSEFGISSDTTITLGMTSYLFGLACGPMFMAPLSELYGRRIVYLVSLCLYFLFVIPSCVATNFYTILIVRFFGAIAGSVTISNAPGTLGDIFSEEYRPLAFSLFFLAAMNGPVLGPIIGGFVYQSLGWRWNNWIVLIAAGVLGLMGLAHPETYAPELLRRRAAKLREETGDERYMSRFCSKGGEGNLAHLIKLNLKRPVLMLVTEPICIFWALYTGAIYAVLYMCFTAYPIVFSEIRGWGPGISGLAFTGMGFGAALAVATEPLSRKIYNMHSVDPDTGKRPPEAQILVVVAAAVIIPISLFGFALTCVPVSVHWAWPILSGVPYGFGNTYVFLHSNNYLVTSYDIFAASAVAGNAIIRSILGGVMPLFAPLMYRRMGPTWAATTVAFIAVGLIPIPWVFYKWGKIIRLRSPMLQKLQKERAERGE